MFFVFPQAKEAAPEVPSESGVQGPASEASEPEKPSEARKKLAYLLGKWW